MPIRVYKCVQCTHEFENLYLSFAEEEREKSNVACPKCGTKDVETQITGTSFALKGRGWHNNDYGKRGPKR